MKNVLMIFFLLGGLAITSANAQSCCIPCPPGCCVASCKVSGKAGVATLNDQPVGTASLVAFSPEAMTGTCQGKKMSNKEIKACQVACLGMSASAPQDQSHVAPVAANVSQSAPTCQPAATCKPVATAGDPKTAKPSKS